MPDQVRTFPELPGWTFEITEVSPCVYRVRGVDRAGRSVETTGTDTDALLDDCKAWAGKTESAS